MPPKLKRVGGPPGVVNIDRRLKLTAIDDSCSPSNAVTSCDGTPGLSSVAATLCSHRSAFAEQYPPWGGGTLFNLGGITKTQSLYNDNTVFHNS